MKNQDTPLGQASLLTRRDALMRVLKGAVTAAVGAPAIVQAAPAASAMQPESEHVPENDYPFFGGELPPAYR